ncbi:MAG: hypothetical protein J6B01_04690 [Ruminococcus sp.]|nr:hypothetical protein [Ruminococcus sp.]
MLTLIIPGIEQWDEVNETYVYPNEQILMLEHSLISLSKWESKWCKPFLSTTELTSEETIDYIKCMTISKNVNPEVYNGLTNDHIKQIHDYIAAPMTATTFAKKEGKGQMKGKVITNELLYYWMTALNIPFECEKWHLNRLITLIRVCNEESQPKKKRSRRDIAAEQMALNAKRRAMANSKG